MRLQLERWALLAALLIVARWPNGAQASTSATDFLRPRSLTKRNHVPEDGDHLSGQLSREHQLSADQFASQLDGEPAEQVADQPEAAALLGSQMAASTPASLSSPNQKSPIRTVNPGDRVNIPCSLANMGGSIQFAKDDQPIILDSGCAHCQLDISNDGQASLTINRVSQRDQGHWQCWRLDGQGKVKQKIPIIQLVVTNSPELPILIVNDKELLGGNNLDATITIKENEIVNFKCLIKGAPTAVDYVHWVLDSNTNVTDMSHLMMEYSAQDGTYLTQSLLKLNVTKQMNLKSVSCLSNHQLWLTPMTVTALLNVLYEPSFTISREPGFGVPVSEGMTVILKCEIDSNPSSSPVWIKDADNKTTQNDQGQQQQQFNSKDSAGGEPILLETQEDGSLIFQPARRQDSGWYRCKTENKYGNFSSFGYYLNVRAPSPNGGQQPATSTPASNYIQNSSSAWATQQQQQRPRSDSRVMGPNQPAAFQRHQSPMQQIVVDPIQRSQVANDQPIESPRPASYDAIAGEQSNCPKTRLAEGFPDIKNPVSSVQAVLGRQLVLPLRFCCNPGPTRVFWIHRHLAMIPGRMFGPYITRDLYNTYNSFHCYETTFEIESVKPEDIGTVFVFVSNEKGHAGAQIHIQLAKSEGQLYGQYPGIGSSRFPLLQGASGNLVAGSSGAAPRAALSSWPLLIIAAAALATCWQQLLGHSPLREDPSLQIHIHESPPERRRPRRWPRATHNDRPSARSHLLMMSSLKAVSSTTRTMGRLDAIPLDIR